MSFDPVTMKCLKCLEPVDFHEDGDGFHTSHDCKDDLRERLAEAERQTKWLVGEAQWKLGHTLHRALTAEKRRDEWKAGARSARSRAELAEQRLAEAERQRDVLARALQRVVSVADADGAVLVADTALRETGLDE